MTPAQLDALSDRHQKRERRSWEAPNYWGSTIAAQQVNLTWRGRGAPKAKSSEYLPVFEAPKDAGDRPRDPEVQEHLMMRVARGWKNAGVGTIRPISPERMAEIRAMRAAAS